MYMKYSTTIMKKIKRFMLKSQYKINKIKGNPWITYKWSNIWTSTMVMRLGALEGLVSVKLATPATYGHKIDKKDGTMGLKIYPGFRDIIILTTLW